MAETALKQALRRHACVGREIARRADVPERRFYKLCIGKLQIRLDEAVRIAREIGCDVTELYGEPSMAEVARAE